MGKHDRTGSRFLENTIANYRRAGIRLFVLAYFLRSREEVQAVRAALGLPLQVARLTVPLPVTDLGDLPEEQRASEASRLAGEEARRPFDLSTGPLVL